MNNIKYIHFISHVIFTFILGAILYTFFLDCM